MRIKRDFRFLLVFAIGWTVFTVPFTLFVAVPLFHCWQAASFPTVQGHVLHSEVARNGTGDTPFSTDIKYRYTVRDREYIGTRVRFAEGTSSNPRDAEDDVRRYPVGSTVTVHFDSSDPAQAVLDTKPSSLLLSGVLFMIPFNAIMIGSWGWGLGVLRRHGKDLRAGGLKLIETPDSIQLRAHAPNHGLDTLAAIATSSLLILFGLYFAYGGHPTPSVLLKGIAAVPLFGALAAVLSVVFRRQLTTYLTIDRAQGAVIAPKRRMLKWKREQRIPLRDIREVHCECVTLSQEERRQIRFELESGGPVLLPVYWSSDRLPAVEAFLREQILGKK